MTAVILLGGCTSDPAPDASADPSVVVPGAPGEPNRTLSAAPDDQLPPNEADKTFLADMIVHHAQALQMVALVPGRSSDSVVEGLAGRIEDGQQPEIDAMSALLTEYGGTPPALEHLAHEDHSGMPGMASPAELKRLETLSGRAFDRLFLELMSRHHEGAVTMAKEQLKSGADVRVGEIATDVAITQRKEIGVMTARLKALG